jgi:Na+/H+ antiporter NhaD/arsenite permease-like protein
VSEANRKDLKLRSLRSFVVFATQDDGVAFDAPFCLALRTMHYALHHVRLATSVTPPPSRPTYIAEGKERRMRKALFWFGWAVLCMLPLAFAIEVYTLQDLPPIQPWKWAVAAAAVLLVIAARNRDDVLKHRVA